MFFILSSIKGALSGLRQFLTTENPLKMMKNACYFTWKALLVLMIFQLLSWLFDHTRKRLDLKNKVDFKIDDVKTWEKTIATHIYPNIWRSKVNQTMKFGQLIEYNMRNIFSEKSYTKCDGETIPRPFS